MAMNTINLLKEMIGIRTVNSENGEKIIALIQAYLNDLNLDIKKVQMEKEGVVSAAFFSHAPCTFVINGHYDVVEVNEEEWATQPFSPVEKDGLIFGRGASDMKGGLAAGISAFAELIKTGRPVCLMVVGDEEKGGHRGTEPLLEKLLTDGVISPNARAIIPEPLSVQKPCDHIKQGQRGVLEFVVKITGKGGHASIPQMLNNPIEVGSRLVTYLQSTRWPMGLGMEPTTISATSFQSTGKSPNVIPSSAMITFDCRFNYKTDPKTVEKAVVDFVKDAFCDVDIETIGVMGPSKNRDVEFVEQLKHVVKEVAGFVPFVSTLGGASDARFFVEKGMGAVELGPRPINIHAANEAVSITDVECVEKTIIAYGNTFVKVTDV